MTPPAAPAGATVLRLMEEVRAAIQARRGQGGFGEDDVVALAEDRRRAWAGELAIDPRLLRRLSQGSNDWNLATDYLIRTTRRRLAGALLVTAKRLVRPFVRLYTDHPLNRQAQLNLYLDTLLRHAMRDTARRQLEVGELRKRVSALGEPAER